MTDPVQTPGTGSSGEIASGTGFGAPGTADAPDVTAEVRGRLERSKSDTAARVSSASDVLNQAAEDFSVRGQNVFAQATGTVAGALSTLAEELDHRSVDEFVGAIGRVVNRNPLLFVAGGVALGVVLYKLFNYTEQPAAEPGWAHVDEPNYGLPPDIEEPGGPAAWYSEGSPGTGDGRRA